MFNKKKKTAAAEAEQAQQKQLAALRAELDAMSRSRSELQEHVAGLSETNDELDRRLAALDQGMQSMGEQIVTLSTSSADTNRRVQAIDDRFERVEEFASELDAINRRLQSFEPAAATLPPTPPPTPPPPTPPPATPPPTPPPATPPPPPHTSTVPPPLDDSPPAALPPLIEFDSPEGLDERVAELRDQLDDLARQTSSIDARVTSVSMELANQLTELSSDIDELNRRSSEPGEDSTDVDTAALEARIAERLDVAIDDVLDSTERLAAEQARYEIQFRADLAELAERIRRPGTT